MNTATAIVVVLFCFIDSCQVFIVPAAVVHDTLTDNIVLGTTMTNKPL